jgi:hypothetical protein
VTPLSWPNSRSSSATGSPPTASTLVGHPACGLSQLRTDPDRFIFLPGGNNGEPLFDPDQQ